MATKTVAAVSAAVLLLAGCANTGEVVQINRGVYSVSARSGWIRGGEANARTRALTTASAYCAGQGRQLSVQGADSRTDALSSQSTSDVVFRCDASEPGERP